MSKTRTIKVDYLARVEGEGALWVRIKDGRVDDVKLKIFEPPRFFEALLRGRAFTEAPDITARICGICPVAYQMSAVHAIEDAFDVPIHPAVRALRRLLYCGEWIESHVLHIVMLHAPDFLGHPDAIRMAADHPELVRKSLALKKVGNAIMRTVGGREIHPINVRVGGFYRAPTRRDLAPLREQLSWARDAAHELLEWTGTLTFPAFEQDYEFVALSHPDEYPLNEGRLVSSRGLDISAAEFDQHFEELHVPHSNALHSVLRARGAYCVGPLARFNLNAARLPAPLREAAAAAGLVAPCRNPYRGIVARAVEVLWACEEALAIIAAYEPPPEPAAPVEPRSAAGHACTEAPRGILYHGYRLGEHGEILDARIVPPTSQNQRTIEDDLRAVVSENVTLETPALQARCEQMIRNYDPCISCATHFLRMHVEHA